MIDLHCHTTYSDGTWSVKELLKQAELTKINLLSITDHDSVKAHFELEDIDISEIYSGRIIIGAEFNCVFNNAKIELLGYNFNKENVQIYLDGLYGKDRYRIMMLKEFADMCEICKKNKVIIDDNIDYNPDKDYPIDVIYYEVIKHPENKVLIDDEVWNNISLFYRKCTTDKSFILYRDFTKSLPSAKGIAHIIRENGGKVFLAHLFVYKMDDHMSFLEKITDAKIIDGVECYYSRFTDEQIKLIEKFCREHNLYTSGGSDCHGDKNVNIKLGVGYGNLTVNEQEIAKWC